MNENEVINTLESYLKAHNYIIDSKSLTSNTGYDLKAHNEIEVLYIEAKGATSSKEGTSRYGKSFDGRQVLSHVSRALFTAMCIICDDKLESNRVVALALPDDEAHKARIDAVKQVIEKLSIRIYWISEDHVRLG